MAVKKQSTDRYSRTIVTEQDICNRLYCDPKFNYTNIQIQDPSKYNSAVDNLYLDFVKLAKIEELTEDPVSWHDNNQKLWLMPDQYKQMDILNWLLDQCTGETELQRVAEEFLLYHEHDMIDLLRYLKYLVDTMRDNNIVWGVGRGSSVASFILYLIGVHKINSITYSLDVKEFIR